MGFAKKYILTVNDYFSHGVNSSGKTTNYNLCSSFSGTTDDGNNRVFQYSGITLTQLSLMPMIQYQQRASDFLSYVQIDTVNRRNELLNEAYYYTDNCSILYIYDFNQIYGTGTTTTTTTSTTTTTTSTTSTTTTSTTTTLSPRGFSDGFSNGFN